MTGATAVAKRSSKRHTIGAMTRSDIVDLWARRGAIAYQGEGITQLQHAWQCGRLAAQAGAAPALQLAAWLHDLGHLMTDLDGSPTLRGIDDGHEELGGRVLEETFGDAVGGPVRLHVAAKRCLVATRPGYRERLSADSVRSLALQGGPMDAAEAARFATLPWAQDALRLRSWDEAAKVEGLGAPDFEGAMRALTALMEAVPAR